MAKKKDDLIDDAKKLKIELEGNETIAILEKKIEVAETDISSFSFELIIEKIKEYKDEIEKKESRNKTINQLNKNRNSEIELINKKTVLKQTDKDKKEIKEKNKVINENNRQLSKNLSEIMELKLKINELDREKKLRIPVIVNSYAIEYIKAKCAKDYVCDEIINSIIELIEKQKELEKVEIDKRLELNNILSKYNVGDISADMIELENELDVNKTKLSRKLISYVRTYAKKITQFKK